MERRMIVFIQSDTRRIFSWKCLTTLGGRSAAEEVAVRIEINLTYL